MALPGASTTILAAARLPHKATPARPLILARPHTGIWAASILAALVGLLSLVWHWQAGLVTALPDATARLLLARTAVEGLQIGPASLSSDLPLPQALITALAWDNFLYSSGLAGALVSWAAYVIACIFIYKLVLGLTDSRLAAWTAIIFFSGPNVLYLQATPLPLMVFVALFCAFMHFFVAYLQDPHQVQKLLLPALVLMLATLSGYVGWALLVAVLLVMVATFLANRFTYAKAEAHLIFFGFLASFGIIVWLAANQVLFGDWLHFAKVQHALAQSTPGGLSASGSWLSSLTLYALASEQAVGWVAALVAGLGLLAWLLGHMPFSIRLAGLLFLVPLPFCVAMLYTGTLAISVPYLTTGPPLNSAWGILLAPAAGFFAGILAARWQLPYWASAKPTATRASALAARTRQVLRDRPLLLLPALGLLSALVVTLQGPITVSEAQSALSSPTARAQLQAGQWLQGHWSGGLLLEQRSGNEQAVFTSQIPLPAFVSEDDSAAWAPALHDPLAANITWVVMRSAPNPTSQDQVWVALRSSPVLAKGYYLAYQSGGIEVYVRSPGQ
jgi:hypothetical protein